MIALLTNGELKIRPNELVRHLNALDEQHAWTHTATTLDDDPKAVTSETVGFICTGPHGALLTVMDLGGPLDAELIAEARKRSWWYEEGPRASPHRGHWLIAGGKGESWQAAVLRAKASTLIAGLLINDNPSIVAVWNGVNGTLFTPQSVQRDLGFVARNQVPLAFWMYSALHSLTDGDVSITTGGLAPFVGYELEVWHAPRPAELVNRHVNMMSNYLLFSGPIVREGQTVSLGGDLEPFALHVRSQPDRAEQSDQGVVPDLRAGDGRLPGAGVQTLPAEQNTLATMRRRASARNASH